MRQDTLKKEKDTIGIIVLNYNNANDTIQCIDSIMAYNTVDIRIIVVDNGSPLPQTIDDLGHYFAQKFQTQYCKIYEADASQITHLPTLTYLVSPTNDGYARGNNKGLALAFQDSCINKILILNNDVLFVEDIIPILSQKIDAVKDAAIISPILYKKGLREIDYTCARKNHYDWEIIFNFLILFRDVFGIRTKLEKSRFILLNHPEFMGQELVNIELPSGSCMMMNKRLLMEMKGFDPNTFLYFEENILYKKIQSISLKNYLLTNCKCIHLGASTIGVKPNYIVIKSMLYSAIYYLRAYCELSLFKRLALWAAFAAFQPILLYHRIKESTNILNRNIIRMSIWYIVSILLAE